LHLLVAMSPAKAMLLCNERRSSDGVAVLGAIFDTGEQPVPTIENQLQDV